MTGGASEMVFQKGASPRALGKKHYDGPDEYQAWDYLKGSGPAAPDARHPDHKVRFKPGWKTRKKEKDINPWSERVAFEEVKAKEYEVYQEHKKAILEERSSKYNPISGEVFDQGKWEPATNPWVHIQSGKKAVLHPSASSQERMERKEKGAIVRAKLRQDRIVNEGQLSANRDAVKHIFTPEKA